MATVYSIRAVAEAKALLTSPDATTREFARRWLASYQETGRMLEHLDDDVPDAIRSDDGMTVVAFSDGQVRAATAGLRSLLRDKGL